MTFYNECFGGKLNFQTLGESPLSDKMPKKMKKYILHSTLTKDTLILMGSDMVGEKGLVKGNSVSLSLHCTNEEEVQTCYSKLSNGGSQNHPLEKTIWGALFGVLTDKFGNHWILNYQNYSN